MCLSEHDRSTKKELGHIYPKYGLQTSVPDPDLISSQNSLKTLQFVCYKTVWNAPKTNFRPETRRYIFTECNFWERIQIFIQIWKWLT